MSSQDKTPTHSWSTSRTAGYSSQSNTGHLIVSSRGPRTSCDALQKEVTKGPPLLHVYGETPVIGVHLDAIGALC